MKLEVLDELDLERAAEILRRLQSGEDAFEPHSMPEPLATAAREVGLKAGWRKPIVLGTWWGVHPKMVCSARGGENHKEYGLFAAPGFSEWYRPEEQRAIFAHEYGHLVLGHCDAETMPESIAERHAREFAADNFVVWLGYGEVYAKALADNNDDESETHPADKERVRRLNDAIEQRRALVMAA